MFKASNIAQCWVHVPYDMATELSNAFTKSEPGAVLTHGLSTAEGSRCKRP